MAKKKTYGTTASGKPITDELVEKLADKVEAGYDVDDTLHRRGGRPSIGSRRGQRRVGPTRPRAARGTRRARPAGPRDHLFSDPQGAAQVPPSRLSQGHPEPPFRGSGFRSRSIGVLPTVAAPEHAERDPLPDRRRYHRRRTGPSRWLLVVVSFEQDPARIITVVATRKDPTRWKP
jgi:hypothetical protein